MVSIIITSWNALAYLELCLNSLAQYTTVPHEIIIVDNNSVDGSREFLQSIRLQNTRVIYNSINVGHIEANKQALNLSSGDVICLLNEDTVVSDKWLEHLCDVLHEYWLEGVRIVGPLQLSTSLRHPYQQSNCRAYWDQTKASFAGTPYDLLSAFCNGFSYGTFVNDLLIVNKGGDTIIDSPPDFVSGSCMVLSRSIIADIGFFMHPSLRIYGPDDVHLCWSAAKHGHSTIRTHRTYVHHFKHAAIEANQFDRTPYLQEANNVIFHEWASTLDKFIDRKQADGDSLESITNRYYMIKKYMDWRVEKTLPRELC